MESHISRRGILGGSNWSPEWFIRLLSALPLQAMHNSARLTG